jgi:hypothetical protein
MTLKPSEAPLNGFLDNACFLSYDIIFLDFQ